MNIQLEPHALTSYSYPKVNVGISCVDEVEPNYTEYNLFCLKTRLRPYVEKHLSSSLTIQTIPVQRGDVFYIGIRLTDVDRDVKISSSEADRLQETVTIIQTTHPNHCLLFSPNFDLQVNGVTIPSTWIMSMIPYLPIEASMKPYLEGGSLFVDLSDHPIFDQDYNTLQELIQNRLQIYYRRGAVICNQGFADQWGLKSVRLLGVESIYDEDDLAEDEVTSELTDNTGLYVPTWNDIRITRDRVEFLTQRMADDMLIRLEINPIGRQDRIEKILDGYVFTLQDDSVVLSGQFDIDDLRTLVNRVSM